MSNFTLDVLTTYRQLAASNQGQGQVRTLAGEEEGDEERR